MISSAFLIRIVIGLSIWLAFFSRRLIPFPDHSPILRGIFPFFWFIFWLNVGTWETRGEKATIFQKSWEGLGSISKLEYCSEPPNATQRMGKAAAQFENLKRSLEVSQNWDGPKSMPEIASPQQQICKGRLPDEPWLHFHHRLINNNLNAVQKAFNEFSILQTFNHLSTTFISGKNIAKADAARFAEWIWVLLQTGVKQTSFHQLWIEGFLPFQEYPTSKEIAHALVSPDHPEWGFVQKLAQFLLPIPQRWKSDPVAPNLLNLPLTGFCEKAAKDPTLSTQTKSLWKHLRLFYEGCERRENKLGAMPEECTTANIRKTLTIACIEKGAIDGPLQRRSTIIEWPGLPSTLNLTTETLTISKNYFESDTKALPYRSYRLLSMIEQILLPTSGTEVRANETTSVSSDLDFDRPQLLSGPFFELTRLQILQTINPLGSKELSTEIQPYFWYDVFGPRIDRFRGIFIKRLHTIKGELE